MKHGSIKAAISVIFSLLLGYAVATQLSAFLGIEFFPKDLPVEATSRSAPAAAQAVDQEPAPFAAVAAIVLPEGASQDDGGSERSAYTTAAGVLADAVQARTGQRPQILEATDPRPEGPLILVGAAAKSQMSAGPSGDIPPELDPQVGSSEVFALMPVETPGGQRSLAIVGGSPSGDAYGMYRLADQLVTGRDGESLFSQQQLYAPAMKYRLVDLGAVGIPQDPARWDPTNYSHHLRALEDMLLAQSPYVDREEFVAVQAQFADYVQRMVAYGNNGIVIPGFLEFVNFERVGDGFQIYPADSEYRARHLALRNAFNQLVEHAQMMGMQVYLYTDMLALTPPLEAYFQERFGGLDTENAGFWQVYARGLEELLASMPALDGIMIRIGEAGTIYNLPGWDYYSALAVRSVEAAQAMLAAFLEVAESQDKTIIFRTWSVGVGQVGDMHTNPESYATLLASLSSPNLVVSTKYVMGDFYSYLPFNPTLREGSQQRIVEFQNRLEFEGFMAFPDYIAPMHQQALRMLRPDNPGIDGFWQWNQNGGPQQAGPMSLYPFYGFWQNIDANTYVTSHLGWEPDADAMSLAEDWVRRTFGNDPEAVANLTQVLLLSREPVLKGLYVSPFARQQVNALGLETTPMMWIFEWDIVDGSNSVLSTVYLTSREQVDGAIDEGFEAAESVRQMQALLADIPPSQVSEPELLAKLADSLAYEADLFQTLAWYREAFLRYYQWLDTGDSIAARDWQTALERFEQQRAAHLARYATDLDFPAFNFFAADIGMAHARRAQTMAWLARLLLLGMLLMLLAGSGPVARRGPDYPGKTGLRAVWLALTAPFKVHGLPAPAKADWLTATVLPLGLVALSYLTFSSFLSLQYALLTATIIGVFVLVLYLLNAPISRRAGSGNQIAWLAAPAASLLSTTLLLTAVVAVRGPGLFWYGFWTNPAFRTGFVVLNAAALVWMFFVLYAVQRVQLRLTVLRASGNLVLAVGAVLFVLGVVPAVFGLERTITALNDEMAILPLGLSRILGITTHLGIPASLPGITMMAGTMLMLVGALWLVSAGMVARRRTRRTPRSLAST